MQQGLEVHGLKKSYPSAQGPVEILRGIDLSVAPGESVAVMGPSGSGKSTLLYLLGTLEPPSAGTVRLDGTDPFALSGSALARWRNQRIGFVFQDHYLLPQCTVLENVLVPAVPWRGIDERMRERARELLARVGLGDRATAWPAQLSGGERQRVAVARALLLSPRLLLADEPTGNLDRRTAQAVVTLLLDLATHERAILIVVTHSREVALRLQRRYTLCDGFLQPLDSSY
ncbi:MAG: ATP-binding protein [Gemmataceae bacterium]